VRNSTHRRPAMCVPLCCILVPKGLTLRPFIVPQKSLIASLLTALPPKRQRMRVFHDSLRSARDVPHPTYRAHATKRTSAMTVKRAKSRPHTQCQNLRKVEHKDKRPNSKTPPRKLFAMHNAKETSLATIRTARLLDCGVHLVSRLPLAAPPVVCCAQNS